MNFKRFVISFFLLFVYALSFAHALIPHTTSFYNTVKEQALVSSTQQKHLHQHHCKTINESHIKHNSHCDENIFDLLICLFSDIQHHHSDDTDNYFNVINNIKINSTVTYYTTLNNLTVGSTKFTFHFNEKVKKSRYLSKKYLPPLIDTPQLRGPPIC